MPRRSDWYWPLAWALLSPVVTVPLTRLILYLIPHFSEADLLGEPCWDHGDYCGFDYWHVGDARLAHLPGLLNLVPFAWLVCPSVRTKLAAVLAGLLGAMRLVVPVLILEDYSVSFQGEPYISLRDMIWRVSGYSVGLWFLTVAAFIVFGVVSETAAWLAPRRERPKSGPPPSA